MKKNINLLRSSKNYQQKLKYFVYFKRATLTLGFVTLVTILLLRLTNSYLQNSLEESQKKLTSLGGKQVETAVRDSDYVTQRLSLIESITKKTQDYQGVFSTLFSLLPSSTASATITQIQVTDKHSIDVGLTFSTEDELNSFLAYIESDTFTRYFRSIDVGSLTLSQSGGSTIPLKLHAIYR